MESAQSYPCPSCGYLVFGEPPGSYATCPFCWWEDDLVQLNYPDSTGANTLSLIAYQLDYQRPERRRELVEKWHLRVPNEEHIQDPGWRLFNPQVDVYLHWGDAEDMQRSIPDDSCLYYWRPDYWLRK